jgi:hypothetical protein
MINSKITLLIHAGVPMGDIGIYLEQHLALSLFFWYVSKRSHQSALDLELIRQPAAA